MKQPPESADVFIDVILDAASEAPRADLLDVRVGPFWTVVHTSIGAGMASNLRSESHLHGAQPIADAGRLDERSPLELAALIRSESVLEAAVGLAAANALLVPIVKGLTEEKAVSILRERGAGKRVAMIGHFPFADELRESCGELLVFERGLGRRDGDLGDEAIDQLLPDADVVAVTATALGAAPIRIRRALRHRHRRPGRRAAGGRAGCRDQADQRRPPGMSVEKLKKK